MSSLSNLLRQCFLCFVERFQYFERLFFSEFFELRPQISDPVGVVGFELF